MPHGSQEATEQASQALEAGQHLLADFGQGQTWFVGNIQKLLVGVHDVTGLPWWISIPVTILSIRLLLLYPVGKLLAHSHRFSQVQPQIAELAGEMKSANARKDFIAIQNTQTRMQSLFAKHNVNPMKLFALPVLQAPIFIGLFFALKRLANAGWPDFQTGGLAWFTDLTVADPTYILPLVSSLATLTTFEVSLLVPFCTNKKLSMLFSLVPTLVPSRHNHLTSAGPSVVSWSSLSTSSVTYQQ